MKNIFKFTPLALGFLALASCSNDDFLGSAEINGRQKLVITTESLDGTQTRVAFVASNMEALWQNGDQFRVYDEALQKYDVYKWEGEAAFVEGTQRVATHSKALFPGDKVYYAGYDRENDIVTAIMTVPSYTKYDGAEVKNGKVGYVSALPMWGNTTNETENQLEVGLNRLTAFTNITLYQGSGVKAIRVLALAENVTAPTTGKTNAIEAENLDETTPLSGNFEAQLYENGTLVANLSNPVVNSSYKSYIEVNGIEGSNYSQENHIYIPIIPGTYKQLVIQYTTEGEVEEDGFIKDAEWKCIEDKNEKKFGIYKDVVIKRESYLENNLVIGNAPKTAVVSGLKDLSQKLTSNELDGVNVLNVTTKDGGALKVVKDDATLLLPDRDLIINLNCEIDNGSETEHLIINGGNNNNITLNILGGISGHKNIELNSKGLILGGELVDNEEGHTGDHPTIIVKRDVTLGDGVVVPFTTNMNVEMYGGNVTVDAGAGTIESIFNNTTFGNKVTVKSGTVKKIGVDNASTGEVEVTGGNVGAIKTTTGPVTVSGGEVGTLETTTGAVNIANAKVATVTTDARTINVTTAEVETMTAGAANPTITVKGGVTESGTDEVILAKIGKLNLSANNTAKVNSSGKAAIVTMTNSATATFKSEWNDKNIAVDNTLIGTAGEIYTAAQLAGLGTGTQKTKYKLMADIDIVDDADWTPVNNSKSFDGNAKTITGLNAPLFGLVNGGTIGGAAVANKLTLTEVNINTTEGNQGALAKEINGTVTIQNVEVSGTIGATTGGTEKSVNIGGLVGKATGTVKLIDNKVNATVNGYANVGGYIGNYAGTSITMSVSHRSNFVSTITLNASKDTEIAGGTLSNPLAGTFGNLVGSLTAAKGTVAVNIVKTADYNAAGEFGDVNYFTSDAVDTETLKFENNVRYDEDGVKHTFVGMDKHEIGYSPAPAATLILYKEEDGLGNSLKYGIDDINVFEK